jgi:hypothetical protein
MTKIELKDWWFEHADRVKTLNNLNFYAIYLVIDYTFGPPIWFDGYEEMWFDSLEELKKAYNSEIWQKELLNMEKHDLFRPGNFQGVWEEGFYVKLKGYNKIPTKADCHRHFGGLKRPYNMTKKDLKDWFYAHAIRALDSEGYMRVPGIIWYTHSFSVTMSPYGPPFADAFCGNWMLDLKGLIKTFESEEMRSQNDHGAEAWDYNDRSQAQIVESVQFVIKK